MAYSHFNPSTLSVGDTAFIALATYGSQRRVTKGEVTKITASGQITVVRQTLATRFDAKGGQIGASSKWHKDQLINEESYNATMGEQQKADRTRKARALAKALSDANFAHMDKTSILEQIEALRAAVEAI